MSDLPSPLKSPVPLICQLGPGIERADGTANVTLVPSISQIAAVPSSFCHRMSDLPSPLKSPVPLICQHRPGIERRRPHRRPWRWAVHQPHRGRAVIVLPEDVGLAVAVEVAGPLICQLGPGSNGPTPPTERGLGRPSATSRPCRRRSATDVGLAVAVEVAGSPLICHVGPGLTGRRPRHTVGLVPSIVHMAAAAIIVLPRMSDLPSPLKSAAATTCHVAPSNIGQDGDGGTPRRVHIVQRVKPGAQALAAELEG